MRRPALGAGVRAFAYVLAGVALVLSHRNVGLAGALVGLTGLALVFARPPRWTWPFLCVLAWLSLSSLWTPSTDDVSWWWRLPGQMAFVAATALVAARARPWEAAVFALAILCGIALLGVEAVTGGAIRDLIPPTELPDKDDVASARGVGLGVQLLPAALLCLWRWRGDGRLTLGAGAAALLCLSLGVWRFGVIANGLALAAALAAGALAYRRPARAPDLLLLAAGLFAVVPLLILLLPPPETLEALSEGPLSWRQRLLAWRHVADAVTASPTALLFGAGQNAGTPLSVALGPVLFPGAPIPIARVPDFAHDMPIQIFHEAGLVGLGLVVLGFVLAARTARGRVWPPDLAAAGAALLAAWLVFALVDADFWASWRWGALGLAVAGLRLARRARPQAVVNLSPGR